MSAGNCCDGGPRAGVSRSGTAARRAADLAQWVAPAATLALLPKCPMCVAAYVALFTGISLSAAAATYLRGGLVALCMTSLVLLIGRRAYRAVAR